MRALKTNGQLNLGETFGVEYAGYILITMGILAVCYLLMQPPAMPMKKQSRAVVAQKSATAPDPVLEAQKAKLLFQRELQRVPTPWGWPGHHVQASNGSRRPLNAEEVHGVSESLHHFVERLFSEKHTIDDREYLLRKDANLRSLVEDRYGRASTLKEQPNRKAKAANDVGPGGSQDQAGKLLSGNQKMVRASVKRQPKELRTPWGW